MPTLKRYYILNILKVLNIIKFDMEDLSRKSDAGKSLISLLKILITISKFFISLAI